MKLLEHKGYGHDLHLAAAVKAKELGISLNDFVRNAISTATPV